ncbi:MAG: hypothetical protein ACOX0N_11955 [Syntrophomonadaceae bacterium]|jgi:hypothetical protein|nr:hypothetical protein [Tissierellia bacterium]
MNNIEIKWITDESGKKYISADGINTRIEINEENKEIKYAKAFFREIIYQSYLNNWEKRIVLISDQDNGVVEVNSIINELICICNNEIESKITVE